MAVRYKISPTLGIAFIFCEGIISEAEYFRIVKTLHNDNTYTIGMRCIIDFFSATEDVSLEGMHIAIRSREELEKKGIEFEYVILLTYSHTIDLFVKTMKLLTKNENMKLEAVSSLKEAISILGYQDRVQEITSFYTQCKNQIKETNLVSEGEETPPDHVLHGRRKQVRETGWELFNE